VNGLDELLAARLTVGRFLAICLAALRVIILMGLIALVSHILYTVTGDCCGV
jgi:hypothetical protein